MTTTIPISTQGRLAKRIGGALVALLALLLWLPPALPGFLDNVYYRGPLSDHFDGDRFFNPDGQFGTGGSKRPSPGRLVSLDRKSHRLNSSHTCASRMPFSA